MFLLRVIILGLLAEVMSVKIQMSNGNVYDIVQQRGQVLYRKRNELVPLPQKLLQEYWEKTSNLYQIRVDGKVYDTADYNNILMVSTPGLFNWHWANERQVNEYKRKKKEDADRIAEHEQQKTRKIIDASLSLTDAKQLYDRYQFPHVCLTSNTQDCPTGSKDSCSSISL